MEIILHIGTDKTGSTAIQHTLSQNRSWFLSHSIYIPKTGFGYRNGHAQVLSTLQPTALKALSTELQEADAQGFRVALLSWEGMVRFNTTMIRRLVSALPSLPIRVLVYLREQAEVIQSGHLQWIEMGEKASEIVAIAQPRTSLEKLSAFLFIRNPRRNYYRRLRKWERCIPHAEFSARVFSRSTLHSGDVIADLLHLLDLSKDENFDVYPANINPSIDVEGAMLIEMWRRSEKPAREVDSLIHLTQLVIDRDGMSTKYFLDEHAVQSIRKHFKRSNQRLAKRYMGSNLYPFSSVSSCWRSEDVNDIQVRAEHLLAKVTQASQTTFCTAGAELPEFVDLVEGWSKPENWGVWSSGERSVARFRVPLHQINGEVDSLRLIIAGHYYGENKATSVTVNAVKFGEQILADDCANLVIPLSALYDNRMVEIVFSHEQPISPLEFNGTKDSRTLSFGITRIGYTLFQA